MSIATSQMKLKTKENVEDQLTIKEFILKHAIKYANNIRK